MSNSFCSPWITKTNSNLRRLEFQTYFDCEPEDENAQERVWEEVAMMRHTFSEHFAAIRNDFERLAMHQKMETCHDLRDVLGRFLRVEVVAESFGFSLPDDD